MILIPIIPLYKNISNYPFIIISTIPVFFHSVLAQGTQNDTSNTTNTTNTSDTSNNRLDTPDNIDEFHIVVTFTIIMVILSWCGCFYVFYRTYKQWILDDRKLKMIHRLPVYTAFSGKQDVLCVLYATWNVLIRTND